MIACRSTATATNGVTVTKERVLNILLPDGWVRPKGYSNGILADGHLLVTGGLIGWDENEQLAGDDFVSQFRQTLKNIVAVLEAGGAKPEHLVRTTWYITDKREYLDNLRGVGQAWREIIGRNFPTMAVVEVKSLMEDRAKVEIEAMAVVPR